MKRWILGLLIVVGLVGLVRGLDLEGRYQREQALAYERMIHNSLSVCYAQEGFYPATLAYLVEHYGVRLDERYWVRYQAFASNLRPEVAVYRIGSQP